MPYKMYSVGYINRVNSTIKLLFQIKLSTSMKLIENIILYWHTDKTRPNDYAQ